MMQTLIKFLGMLSGILILIFVIIRVVLLIVIFNIMFCLTSLTATKSINTAISDNMGKLGYWRTEGRIVMFGPIPDGKKTFM